MKKIIAFIALMNCLYATAQINIKVGDKFIYNVIAGGSTYNFTVVVKSMAPGLAFAYQMTNENQTYGKLSIPATALNNSNKMYNYFSGGDVILKDMTSVLISRDAFKKISTGKTAVLYDGSKKYAFKNDGKDQFTYMHNGQNEQADGYYISDGNYIMTVLNDPKFPLIVSMDLGFSIKLAEYIPAAKGVVNIAACIGHKMSDGDCKFLFSKVDRTAAVFVEDLTGVGGDKKPAVHIEYYAYAEGLKVETMNDTVTGIMYYPNELYHGDRKYYGAHFSIPQVKNVLLPRPQQKKNVDGKFVKTMQYDADKYSVTNNVSMELYYHIPAKGAHGWTFNANGEGQPLKQKLAFVLFE